MIASKHTNHFAPRYETLCGRHVVEPFAKIFDVTCMRCRQLFEKESAVGAHVWALEADQYLPAQYHAHVAELYRIAAVKHETLIKRVREALEEQIEKKAACLARAVEIESEKATANVGR